MWLGLAWMFAPFIAIFTWIPLVGKFIGYALWLAVGIFAFCVAVIGSLSTVCLAWIFYRPVLAIILLVIIASVVAAMFLIHK